MLCSILKFRRILPEKVTEVEEKISISFKCSSTLFKNRLILYAQTLPTPSIYRLLRHHLVIFCSAAEVKVRESQRC